MRRVLALAFALAPLCIYGCIAQATIGSDAAPDAAEASSEDASTADAPSLPPVQLAGRYTLVIKAGANGCSFASWNEGSLGVADVVLLEGSPGVQATVEGLAALTFGLLLGRTDLAGVISGRTLSLSSAGTTRAELNGCSYTIDANVEATIEGDTLQGVITYSRNLGDKAECAAYACTSVSPFTGLRSSADQ